MGQPYCVSLLAKITDEQGAIQALQNKIRQDEQSDARPTTYSLDKYAAQGVGTDTFDDLMRIFFAGWQGQEIEIDTEHPDGFIMYHNEFNASYGWESVLEEMIYVLAPYLEDGSEFEIVPEHGILHFDIKDHAAINNPHYILDAGDSPLQLYEIFESDEEVLQWLEEKTGYKKTVDEWNNLFEDEERMVEELGDEWEDAYVRIE